MLDDPDYRPQSTGARPRRSAPVGLGRTRLATTDTTDLTNRWPLHGDPTRLVAAAAVLRAGDAEQIFGARFPGEFVMSSLAHLLEAIAHANDTHIDLNHDVVSAATEIAEHVLAYVPRNGAER